MATEFTQDEIDDYERSVAMVQLSQDRERVRLAIEELITDLGRDRALRLIHLVLSEL